ESLVVGVVPMMESSESNSDDEFDQAELEAALYGQFHYDTSLSAEFLPKMQTQYFAVDVHELAGTQSLPKTSQSYHLGGSVAFSKDKNTDPNGVETKNLHKTRNVDSERSFNTVKNIKMEDVIHRKKIFLKNEISTVNACKSEMDDKKLDLFEIDFHETPSTSGDTSRVGVSIKQNLLPFEITKKSKNKVPEKSQFVVIDDDDNDDYEVAINQEEHHKSVYKFYNSKGVKKMPKIEDFLVLSQSGTSGGPLSKVTKRKSLSKGEAAVKPRKPEVQVRRPPPAIPVRYKQDTDTETDYSDSDTTTSHMPTPTKKIPKGQTMNDIQNASALSCNILLGKFGDPVNDDNDAEESLSKEDVKENLQDSESKNRLMNVRSRAVSSDAGTDSSGSECTGDEEEDSEDSDSTTGALIDDMPVPFMPNLDFNLTGGVSKLLSGETGAKPETPEDKWKIDEKDRYKNKSLTSRYFAPRPIQCRNCRKNGHLSRDCPEPLRQRCIFCCEEGHQFKTCPQAICHNCGTPGHKSSDCKEPRMDWNIPCDRCWMTGHREEMCPDKWRQLHLSLNVDDLHLPSNHKYGKNHDEKRNPRVYCYNCGKKGHLGYECRLQRMNRFVPPSYPLVAYYDCKSDIRRVMRSHRMPPHNDIESERKTRKQERKRNRPDKDTKHTAKKRGRSSGEAQQRQHHSGVSNQYPLNEKKELNREKHKRQKKGSTSGHEQNIRSVPFKYDRRAEHMQSFSASNEDYGPSTSRSYRQHGDFDFFDTDPTPGPLKSRKRQWDGVSPTVESEDSFDDMAQHQVSRNEWWLDGPEAKRRKKVRGSRGGVRVQQKKQSNLSYSLEDPEVESRFQTWRDKQNKGDYESMERSSFKQPQTTFVYVDEHPPPFHTQRAPHLSEKLGHFDNPEHNLMPVRNSNNTQQQRCRETDRSPPKAVKHLRSHNFFNKGEKKKGRDSHFRSSVHYEDLFLYGGRNSGSIEGRNKSHSKSWKNKDPASWPGAREKKRSGPISGPGPNNRGFKSRHERFVSMKNDCDIRVSMRK
ncbi:zinc finger CCHC domain-containing protein 7, partial [Elysia marginata]